jgi:hypothetical protein
VNGGGGDPGGGVNTPVWGGLGMFAVGDTDGEVDDGPVVVVAGALDVLVVVVVVVEGLLLALLPHAAVNAPAAMIATAPAAAAMRPAVNPDVMSVRPIVRPVGAITLATTPRRGRGFGAVGELVASRSQWIDRQRFDALPYASTIT